MTVVNTVLGPLDTADLGFTLAHEHVLACSAGFARDYPDLFGADFMGRIIQGLTKAKAGGVNTIVDASTHDLGRDVALLARASQESGVNIIACTGWWLDIPRFLAGVSADQLARVFVREIREGISGTDIKAGVLKAASDLNGVTPGEKTVLRAVARAHLETGVPIMLHSYAPGRVGAQQLAVLRDEGVEPRRVKVDHSNDTTDVEYLISLLDQGCYLGLDRYPGRNVSPLSRTRTMKALIDAGYAGRLLPSHDFPLVRVLADPPQETDEQREMRSSHGYLYIKDVVFPWLRDMGVSKAAVDSLCVDGPRSFFGGV